MNLDFSFWATFKAWMVDVRQYHLLPMDYPSIDCKSPLGMSAIISMMDPFNRNRCVPVGDCDAYIIFG